MRSFDRMLACLVCALLLLGAGAEAGPITSNTALPVHDGELIFREQLMWIRSTGDPGPTQMNLNVVIAPTVLYYGVNADDLKARSRHKQIVEPRQLAMYLLREDAHLSTPEVGRLLNRDHTTVLHGIKQVANDIARDGPSRAAVRGVREVIAGGGPEVLPLRDDASDRSG